MFLVNRDAPLCDVGTESELSGSVLGGDEIEGVGSTGNGGVTDYDGLVEGDGRGFVCAKPPSFVPGNQFAPDGAVFPGFGVFSMRTTVGDHDEITGLPITYPGADGRGRAGPGFGLSEERGRNDGCQKGEYEQGAKHFHIKSS